MATINRKRVILGGLVAGLVSNISGILQAHFLFAGYVRSIVQSLGIVTFPPYTVYLHLASRFGMGLAVTWLYAALLPRFGPGAGTAVIVGTVAWLFSFVFFAVGMLPWGLFPPEFLLAWSAGGLVEMVLVALAGRWFYKEPA